MINRLIDAFRKMDYAAVKNCFEDSDKVQYIDYCPINVGFDNYFIYGSNAIEIFFRSSFAYNTFSIYEEQIENDNTATFFGCHNSKFYFARLTIEELGYNGLIKKVVVRPV